MRVLLDESIPRQLAAALVGHSVSTVRREGWAGLRNGELLSRAALSFEAFVTGDQGLEFQQAYSRLSLGIIVVVASNNRVETILALSERILDSLAIVGPGRVIRVIE